MKVLAGQPYPGDRLTAPKCNLAFADTQFCRSNGLYSPMYRRKNGPGHGVSLKKVVKGHK